MPLVARAWGAPLGQPFADDFHFLHHAIFRDPGGWLDGGGAVIYWRPLSRQAYFGLLSPVLLAAPWVVALLHAVVLALASLLLHRAWRSAWPGPWAAAAASFPLLAESSRSLLLWPSAFQDLGALGFSAVALHEASRRRMATALPALAAALLCKEIAVVTAVLLPWLPWGEVERRERRRWALATGATVLAWGLVYALVMRGVGVMFQRHLEAPPPPLPARFAWALASSLGDAFGLGAAGGATTALAFLAAALVALAVGAAAISPNGRARLRSAAPWIAWGLAWFLANASTLTQVYPVWGPFRSAFGMVGLGVAVVGLAWAAGPVWLAALVSLRLAALALAPGPPGDIAPAPYREEASLDFASLTRLSRLAARTESALRSRHASLPPRAVVVWHHRPRLADHAFAGDKALQTWYRDTTLRMAWWDDVSAGGVPGVDAVLEYQERGPRQVVTVEPRAMASYLEAIPAMEAGDCSSALGRLARADSLQADRGAKVFRARVAGKRAVCFLGEERLDAARREAERSLALWPEGGDSRYVLAVLLVVGGRVPAARAQLDTLLALYPFDVSARQLLDTLKARAR